MHRSYDGDGAPREHTHEHVGCETAVNIMLDWGEILWKGKATAEGGNNRMKFAISKIMSTPPFNTGDLVTGRPRNYSGCTPAGMAMTFATIGRFEIRELAPHLSFFPPCSQTLW